MNIYTIGADDSKAAGQIEKLYLHSRTRKSEIIERYRAICTCTAATIGWHTTYQGAETILKNHMTTSTHKLHNGK